MATVVRGMDDHRFTSGGTILGFSSGGTILAAAALSGTTAILLHAHELFNRLAFQSEPGHDSYDVSQYRTITLDTKHVGAQPELVTISGAEEMSVLPITFALGTRSAVKVGRRAFRFARDLL